MKPIDWRGAADRLVYAIVPALVALTAGASATDNWAAVWNAVIHPAFIIPLIAVSLGISVGASQAGDKTASVLGKKNGDG